MTHTSDRARLRKLLLARKHQRLSMPYLRRLFPGCLTQRLSELKRDGLQVENERRRVNGKTHSVYICSGEAR